MSLSHFSKDYNLRTKHGQEMRKRAWPAIRSVLLDIGLDTRRINEICKPLYLEGVEPSDSGWGLEISKYLMCNPLASKTKWRQIKRSNLRLAQSRVAFMDVQASGYAYAYGNTMYAGREKEIYDYFYADVKDTDLYWTAEAAPNQIVGAYLRPVCAALGDMRPNEYTQLWRYIDQCEHALQVAAKKGAKAWRGSKFARTLFCYVTFICRHPDLFDELVVGHAKRLNKMFSNKKLHAPLAESYKKNVDKDFERFCKLSAAGSRVSFAIRYPDAEYMQASYDMLYDETRYPRTEDLPECVPINLPRERREGVLVRFSEKLIVDLWASGFYVEECDQLDEKTLIARTWVPLDSGRVLSLLGRLCMNLCAIRWRINSRDGHQDEFTSASVVGKGVYALELPGGEVRAGTLGYTNPHQATSGFNKDTKLAFDQLDSLEESMKILIEQRTHLQKIGKDRKDWKA